ncbi:MAG: VanZ family protein [Dehalococcoidia bacterium]|nr:VanZ family protein [Dehalococcoidia bacterium]
MKQRWLHRAGFVAFAASLALIAYATLTPSPSSGGTPDWLAHVLLFAALGGSATLAFTSAERPARGALLALVLAIGLGAATELAQGPLETRSPSLADWLADTLGASGGVLVGLAMVKALARRE